MTIYKNAGVDITAGDYFTQLIKERVGKAWNGTEHEIGRFAAEARIPAATKRIKASTDGVGTAAIIAAMLGSFELLGQKAVAGTILDLYVDGNRPAYLLDTIKVAHLQPEVHIKIIEGIISACSTSGCRLIGGETAELPGVYRHDWMVDVDVTAIGFPRPGLGYPISTGQEIYGWPSDGPALNGFSLLRKLLRLDIQNGAMQPLREFLRQKGSVRRIRKTLESYRPELRMTLAEALLAPTPLWIGEIEQLKEDGIVFAGEPSLAHITGGGMPGNISRILPYDLKAVIECGSWSRPPIFHVVQEIGKVHPNEMNRVFNQGIMLVGIVDTNAGPRPTDSNAYPIGQIEKRIGDEPQVQLIGKHNDA